MNYLLFCIFAFCSTHLFANDLIMIRGRVVSESGEELIGANVSVLEGSAGTATDVNGNYSFEVYQDASKNQ